MIFEFLVVLTLLIISVRGFHLAYLVHPKWCLLLLINPLALIVGIVDLVSGTNLVQVVSEKIKFK